MNRLSINCLLTVPPKRFSPVLLHNGNNYQSIPLAYSIQIKEGYENVKKLLFKTSYAEFNGMFVIILICWKFCWVCVMAIPNSRVFFACGTAELMESTVRRSIAISLQGKN